MAITTYAELQAAIADWLNREDLTAQIPDFIALAESTLNRVLRDGRMVTSATSALTSGAATIATDALEIVYAQVSGDNNQTLEQISPAHLMIERRARMKTAGAPRVFAIVGRNLMVAPIPSTATSVVISYFQALPALASNSTNWLLTYHPDMYLYASLMHAAPFLKDEARLAVMQGAVATQIRDAAVRAEGLSLDNMRVPGVTTQPAPVIPATPRVA